MKVQLKDVGPQTAYIVQVEVVKYHIEEGQHSDEAEYELEEAYWLTVDNDRTAAYNLAEAVARPFDAVPRYPEEELTETQQAITSLAHLIARRACNPDHGLLTTELEFIYALLHTIEDRIAPYT